MATDRQRPLQTNLLNRRICRLCFIYNKFVKLQTLILHLYQFICQKHICIDNIGSLYVKIVASKTTFPTVKSPIYDLNSSNSILLYDNENIIFTRNCIYIFSDWLPPIAKFTRYNHVRRYLSATSGRR